MAKCAQQPFIFKHRACLECEQPNGNLHKFRGRFTVAHESVGEGPRHTSIPVAMSEMLLRGTVLKNSKYVVTDNTVFDFSIVGFWRSGYSCGILPSFESILKQIVLPVVQHAVKN